MPQQTKASGSSRKAASCRCPFVLIQIPMKTASAVVGLDAQDGLHIGARTGGRIGEPNQVIGCGSGIVQRRLGSSRQRGSSVERDRLQRRRPVAEASGEGLPKIPNAL